LANFANKISSGKKQKSFGVGILANVSWPRPKVTQKYENKLRADGSFNLMSGVQVV